VLFTDTVGFIQKLPTQLVAAFRATLEEIADAALLLHVVDVSHPNAAAQSQAVFDVLADLKVEHIPLLTVWNKVGWRQRPWALGNAFPMFPASLKLTGYSESHLACRIAFLVLFGSHT
jgi:50S ribosomal subunit-associated GTPase HflX